MSSFEAHELTQRAPTQTPPEIGFVCSNAEIRTSLTPAA